MDSLQADATLNPAIEETSAVYLARWNQLISTTNWEKGRIIHQWREALAVAGAAVAEYSDEAWSRRLQSATPQHIGRLRRVWERFGQRYTDFDGLYWSHFQVALDWSDAEMWLEGAVQNNWSISEMRAARVTTLTAAGQEVNDTLDSDPALDSASADVADSLAEERTAKGSEPADDPLHPSPSRMDALDEEYEEAEAVAGDFKDGTAFDDENLEEPVRPFASLAELPPDLADAFEAFKLGILRHKLAGWIEIARDDVLGSLDALKQLALAPSE